MMIRARALCLAILLCGAVTACGPIGALSRGGVASALADNNSATAIKTRMSRAQGFALGNVDVEVTGGVVLLSGSVPRPEDRIEAERIAWTGDTVREVANEIEVGDGAGFGRSTRDELTAQAVRTALLANGQVTGINYNVEVANGVAYLLGVARSSAELERAAETAARVNGVQRVVTYVRIQGQPAQ
jgi:osmotically-inducible protein OsmY